jgi:hypothetical protein
MDLSLETSDSINLSISGKGLATKEILFEIRSLIEKSENEDRFDVYWLTNLKLF